MKEIQLTRGYVAFVDDEDFERMSKHKWIANITKRSNTVYAHNIDYSDYKKPISNLMHRLILNVANSDITVDHINGNGLDNRRCNLRLATLTQQQFNIKSRRGSSSKFKGVSFDNQYKLWIAQIRINGKNKKLGRFISEKEAALRYNEEAIKFHGEFVLLNII